MTAYEQMIQRLARAICQERCAFMGEPACWEVEDGKLSPDCDEPGCLVFAAATFDADEAEGWARVPEKATEEMVKAAMGDDAIAVGDGVAEDITAAIAAGRIRRTE